MNSWIIFALLSAGSAALVAVFGKIGINRVDSTLATTFRAVIMAIVLIVTSVLLGKYKIFNQIDHTALIFITLSGLAGAGSWFFYFLALKNGPATGVAALDRLSVVFVFMCSVLFLGEKFSWFSALGAILITIGAIILTIS